MPRAQPGQRFGGRQKGTPNKTTAIVKDVIATAAEKLGGIKRIVEWAKEDKANERLFWASIYPKLLPFTVAGDPNSPVEMVRIERVIVDARERLAHLISGETAALETEERAVQTSRP
jgi:hypothetical protein